MRLQVKFGIAAAAFTGLTTKRFTGQYHESTLPGGEGLYYYNARWYDAKLGRFVSADSLVPSPGNPQSFNRYSYVYNNPLRFVDPTGHAPGGPEFDGGGSCASVGSCYTMQSNQAAAQEMAQFNRFTLNAAGAVPYLDTGEDFLVATTGCSYACQAGYEGKVGLGWRLLAGAGLLLPFGYRSAKTGLAGLERVQDAIAAAAEPGMIIYLRSRPNVPPLVERFISAKPKDVKWSIELPWGTRLINKYPFLVYSDVDIAYIWQDGRILTEVTDPDTIQRIIEAINVNYGRQIVRHGDHFSGMIAGYSGASREKFASGSFFAFGSEGFLGVTNGVRGPLLDSFIEHFR